MEDRWDFYRDKRFEWRWTRVASNGRIVGASCEGYKNRTDCLDNAIRNGYKMGGDNDGKTDNTEDEDTGAHASSPCDNTA